MGCASLLIDRTRFTNNTCGGWVRGGAAFAATLTRNVTVTSSTVRYPPSAATFSPILPTPASRASPRLHPWRRCHRTSADITAPPPHSVAASQFENNKNNDSSSLTEGGAVSVYALGRPLGGAPTVFRNCSFSGTIFSAFGGALNFNTDDGLPTELVVEGCHFEGNVASNGPAMCVSAAMSTVTVSDSVFVGNRCARRRQEPAAANVLQQIPINESRKAAFASLSCRQSYSLTFLPPSVWSAARCRAIAGGGAIAVYYSTLVLNRCRFDSNIAGIVSAGGAVKAKHFANVLATDTVFTNNSAGGGGAVQLQFLSRLVATNCTFDRNRAVFNDLGQARPALPQRQYTLRERGGVLSLLTCTT